MTKKLSFAAFCLFALVFFATIATAAPFLPGVYYTVGGAGTIISADFNHDGFVDVACLSFINKAPYLEVFLNNGSGSLSHAATLPIPNSTVALAAGDLNNDGFPDVIAVANGPKSQTLTVYLGKGTGAFTKGQVYLVGQGPTQAVIADFNNDGKQDVAVVNSVHGGIMIFLGNGNGTLTPSESYRGTTDPISIAAGDLNGDGFVDILVGGQAGNVAALINQKNGLFSNGVTSKVDPNPVSIVLADLNKDGKLDAVVATSTNSLVDVLLGNGDGTFGKSKGFTVGNIGTGLMQVAVADFNVDGNLDVAVAASHGGIIMLYGKGDGGVMAPFGIGVDGSGATSVVTSDFKNDGIADLALTDVVGEIGVFLNEQ